MAETPLQEQVSIVTGASHGIGRAIALRLAGLGSTVIVASRGQARLQELTEDIGREGGRAVAVPTDLRSPEAITALIAGTIRDHGRIDILINNAGVGTFGLPLHETTPETWEATFSTNVRAVYLAMRAVAPHMIARRAGHVINISSLAAHNPVPHAAAYAASKWALKGLSISAAEELRAHSIRVSLICPGSVDTDLSPELARNKARERMLQPDDVALAVEMLVRQESRSFISEVLIRPTQKP